MNVVRISCYLRITAPYLGEALLLKIRNDALPQESRSTNNMQHLLIIVTQQCEFETVFGRIECNSPRTRRMVQAMCNFSLDAREIYGVVERANHAVVPRITKSACKGWNIVDSRTLEEGNI